MKIKITSPFETFGGTFKTTDLIFRGTGRKGELIASAKIKQTNPKTPDQEAARKFQKLAVQHWGEITRDQRLAWNRFAQTYADESERAGRAICREAARMRLILGLPPRADAPQFAFPLRVGELTCEPSADPHSFTFRVTHAMESTAGYVLMIKITQQTSHARTPRAQDARCICGLGPQSTVPLPASGSTVTFEHARFALEPSYPFGVVATIIRVEDGLASEGTFFEFVR